MIRRTRAAGAGVGVVPLRTTGTQGNIEQVEVRGLGLSRPFVLVTERGRTLSPAAEVELSVPTTYNAVVEAIVSGELDLAYFGGLTYVQARQRADLHTSTMLPKQ